MSLLRGWLKPDFTKAEERFIDPDGAPFDGNPQGERSIRRAVQTPAFKATAIASVFLAAAAALSVAQGNRQGALLTLFASISVSAVMLKRDYARIRRREYPALRNSVVIDKAGGIPNDPEVLFALDDDYRRTVESAPRFLPLIPVIVCGGLTGFNYFHGLPTLQHAGLGAVVAVMLSVPFAARTVWSAYARHQLAERLWTVTANPPPLRKEAEEPAPFGFRSALAPIRARTASVPNGL